jgi:hypothetical protein
MGSTALWTGDAAESMVDQRAAQITGTTAHHRRMGAIGHWCSPAVAEEDKQDEVVPEGCSQEYKLQWRGGAMTTKSGGGLSSV